MEGILRNNKFRVLKEIENYWSEDSVEKNYNCPECGTPPCKCSAVIYGKLK